MSLHNPVLPQETNDHLVIRMERKGDAVTHDLKTWPEVFQAMWDKRKRFEFRKNDRDFSVWDFLHLREYDPDTSNYTGRSMKACIRYIIHGGEGVFGIPHGYCIMDVDVVDWFSQ